MENLRYIRSMEKWKKVPTITLKNGIKYKPYGYEVSNLGRVRSYKNRYGYGKRKLLPTPTIINGRLDQAGYVQYMISDKKGVRRNIRGHVMVAFAFLGRRKKGMQICHYDDVKTNNRLDNIRYDTIAGNVRDRIRNNKK
jgi:hypothetical protein